MRSCLVGIVKNEEHGIFEWALYHAFMGFDAIVLYDNGSTDGTKDEIARAARFADVRVIDWPMHPGQVQAYNNAMQTLSGEFDTFCMLDADEFLVPLRSADIREFVASCAQYPHVAIQWTMFGSSGHNTRPSGLVTEIYTWRSQQLNRHIKTICRPKLFRHQSIFLNPHYMDGSSYVFADGSPVTWGTRIAGNSTCPSFGKIAHDGPAGLVQINHYWTKSKQEFEAKKARGRATTKNVREDRFEDVDRNDIVDTSIIDRFSDILRRIKDAKSSHFVSL